MTKYFDELSAWFKAYIKHPIGAGADGWDYFFSLIVLALLIWVVIALKNHL